MAWANWSLDPSLIYVGIAALLYVLGSHRSRWPRPLETASFFAGLLTIVIALDSPIDAYADQLFWAQVIDPGPLRPRLIWPVRIAYTASAMVVGWALAVALVLVPHAIYSYYAALPSRPGGISALTDQQIAAGVMWVPGSLAFTIT